MYIVSIEEFWWISQVWLLRFMYNFLIIIYWEFILYVSLKNHGNQETITSETSVKIVVPTCKILKNRKFLLNYRQLPTYLSFFCVHSCVDFVRKSFGGVWILSLSNILFYSLCLSSSKMALQLKVWRQRKRYPFYKQGRAF